MNDGYPCIIKRLEVYCGPQSPYGLQLFIKYEDMELHLGNLGYHLRDISRKARTYSGGCVDGQHTLRFVESKEARLTNFVLVEKLYMRFILDGSVYTA